ncbi:type IX secretion system membrane protein PorP/SprF [Patiriisocius sp. Uisw_017]|jgi:type IX secretion system PorP/SprF family membrane protein|uniref:PorP/SprF family type IX secretion system membrane protein n=1 Tax=Patiriisocius sp. Uisw_017 TaxID=3230968 RepID=UPI0039ECA40D
MKKQISIVLVLLSFTLFIDSASAQQDPQYTQYMYNMNVVNPAYAGSKESISFTALYRQQWSTLEGAPETFTFSGHGALNDRVGLGLSAIRDQLGPVKETNIYADFSYTIPLGETTRLAFGLKAGITLHDVGLVDLTLQDQSDPFFSQNISNTYPNIGAGAFLYGDNYYVGFSVPNLLNSVHLDENGLKYGNETNHYFGTAGYVFQVTDNVKLKPSVLVKSAFDAPVSFDANINALFFEKFELGVSYRLDDSFSGLVGFQVLPEVRVGYAYDAVNSDINVVADSSHEIILTFDLFSRPRTLKSPRYF